MPWIPGKILAFQQHVVLERLVPSLNFVLDLPVVRCAASMIHLLIFQPIGQPAR